MISKKLFVNATAFTAAVALHSSAQGASLQFDQWWVNDVCWYTTCVDDMQPQSVGRDYDRGIVEISISSTKYVFHYTSDGLYPWTVFYYAAQDCSSRPMIYAGGPNAGYLPPLFGEWDGTSAWVPEDGAFGGNPDQFTHFDFTVNAIGDTVSALPHWCTAQTAFTATVKPAVKATLPTFVPPLKPY
jgi:hypothetical protein